MAEIKDGLIEGDDGKVRCWWHQNLPDYLAYHDHEWGHPVTDDHRLFEKICLEGFQAGLSWLTILRKRENFRRGFAGFDFNEIATFGEADVDMLMADAGIVRHRGKIVSTINNARRARELVQERDSLAAYFWSFEPDAVGKAPGEKGSIPSATDTSKRLSKDLKKRGWSFVGPTTVYAFMQAMGLVNDHIEGCYCRDIVEAKRKALDREAILGGA